MGTHVNRPARPRLWGLQLPRSPKVIAGLVILGVFGLLAIVGPLIAPYGPDYHPASIQQAAAQHWVKLVKPPPGSPGLRYPVPLPPSPAHLLGTTYYAQDVLSQLLWSARATVVVGLLAGAIATALSILVGVSAGYLGGRADEGLSLAANVFLAIPSLPLLIVLASYTTRATSDVLVIALVVAVTGWAYGARTLRAQTLSLRNRDFVEAARVSGERSLRIILVEVLPNLTPIVASSFLFTTLYALGAYVALAFLGLAGTQWNWGWMLFWAQQQSAVISGWWWWWAPPGLCIALLGTGLALVNFGIDEFINPRLRTAGRSERAARRAGLRLRQRFGFTPVLSRPPAEPGGTRAAPAPPGTAEPLLEIRGLSVDYGYGGDAVHAVVDCDLVLRRGQVLGLAGESGSGKSTLALAAIRLLRPPGVITSGRVLFHSPPTGGARPRSTDVLAASPEELRTLRWSEVAVVLQSALNALNPVINLGAQFDDLLRAHRPHLGPGERRRRAAELLAMVGIDPGRLRSYPHELSGGMRQRAMIAMALALEPRVVILDEPTTALDVVTQAEILQELVKLRDRMGFAALFISHDLSLLAELADEIAIMYAGRIVERGPAASLFRAPRHPYTERLIHCFPPLHGARRPMQGIPGSPPDLAALPPGCAFHPRCPWAMERCIRDLPGLEAVDGPARGVPIGTGSDGAPAREVACWLHRDGATVPAELALSETGEDR
ncbi:MAG TPA: dipeptide/oligopeptide/nickel ABC transporter permease/ATP-binding protein [Candidatus Dormibacteraeota bacterium]|nr:dipeptide/oligopeptide/nickel ABC transporter permease/ATP-binding protein [Candidatus Dormibacteraeota bacterium]